MARVRPAAHCLVVAVAAFALCAPAALAKSTLSITTQSPANGQTVSGSVVWQVAVSGAAPTRVDFAIDGTVKWSQTASPYVYGGAGGSLDTATLSNGLHSLSATAYGSRGVRPATSKITVTVANTTSAPESLLLSPEPSPTPEPSPEPTSAHSIYWGAWIKDSAGEAPWSMAAASQFEQLAGKPVSLINWSSPFYSSGSCNGYCAFQTSAFNAVRNHGSIPFFSWAPNPGTAGFTDAEVAAGAQDSYIRAWAQAAKTWGHPLFLRFAWEMNGSWFPWGVGNNGTTAADYVAMWRHVHDVFASVGASNVTWTWCPNVDPHGTHTPMSSVYPGDAYVDWTCLDGYNGDNPWTSFNGLFKSSYEAIAETIAPSKPMVVGEMASTEAGGSKAQWITEMLGEVPSAFPKIRGLLWFNKSESGPGGQSDWPIESSTSASNAFAAGIQNSDYVGNAFGGLSTSPIPSP